MGCARFGGFAAPPLGALGDRKMPPRRAMLCAFSALFVLTPMFSFADTAPDATAGGPLLTTNADYQLPPSIDATVLIDRMTEIWARVYRPADLSSGPYPLVIILHGNHETCGIGSNPRLDNNCLYTTTGSCPDGYSMAPSYLGYSYLADLLASWGYVVVSINANRGINCGMGITFDDALNLARGRLVLRHLQWLSEWNRNGGTPDSLGVELQGQLDFSQVALIGHSRGGEGMRAAYNYYRDSGSPWPARIVTPLNVQGIFEIAPVDGQTSRTLNADATVWNVLLPMCDGDVSDLEGVKPFDRMMRVFNEARPTQKSTFTVWGANHNFYNTEWQRNDSPGCVDHPPLWMDGAYESSDQRQTGLFSAMAFIRGNIGPAAAPTFNQNFNPQFSLPSGLAALTRVERGYTDSPHSSVTRVFEDFINATGIGTYGFPTESSGLIVFQGGMPVHDSVQRAARIIWSVPGGYLQTNWTAAGDGRDVSDARTLDLRVSRGYDPSVDVLGNTDFSIQLSMADGSLSAPVQLSTYAYLTGPVGSGDANRHPVLQTARVPLGDFAGADLTQVRGVRLTFDITPTGFIWVTNIRLSNVSGLSGGAVPESAVEGTSLALFEENPAAPISGAADAQIRSVGKRADKRIGREIVVRRKAGRFPVGDALPTLRVGDTTLTKSRYADDGTTDTIIFEATGDPKGEATLQIGAQIYSLGNL